MIFIPDLGPLLLSQESLLRPRSFNNKLLLAARRSGIENIDWEAETWHLTIILAFEPIPLTERLLLISWSWDWNQRLREWSYIRYHQTWYFHPPIKASGAKGGLVRSSRLHINHWIPFPLLCLHDIVFFDTLYSNQCLSRTWECAETVNRFIS